MASRTSKVVRSGQKKNPKRWCNGFGTTGRVCSGKWKVACSGGIDCSSLKMWERMERKLEGSFGKICSWCAGGNILRLRRVQEQMWLKMARIGCVEESGRLPSAGLGCPMTSDPIILGRPSSSFHANLARPQRSSGFAGRPVDYFERPGRPPEPLPARLDCRNSMRRNRPVQNKSKWDCWPAPKCVVA